MLARCAAEHGWLASGAGFAHYAAVWTRDAALTALALGDEQDASQRAATRATVVGAVARQAPLGQVPVAHFVHDRVWDWGETGNTDGTALFVSLCALHLRMQPDDPERDSVLTAADRAISWLRHQDANNLGLVDSQQAADWMDSTLNRSGKVLYVNVLWYAALRAIAMVHERRRDEYEHLGAEVRWRGNMLFWPEDPNAFHTLLAHVPYPGGAPRFSHRTMLAAYGAAIDENRSHYVAHVEYGRFIDACDVLANALAVVTGFADDERARLIVRHLAAGDAVRPYPARSWTAPFTPEWDPHGVRKLDAERFQDPRWHTPPHRYHNAAVWPFIGGHLVAALCVADEREAARTLLPVLAAADRLSADAHDEWGFHEWIAGDTGAPEGAAAQAWSAAAFVMARRALRQEPFRW